MVALRRGLERRGVAPALVVTGDLRRQRQTAQPWLDDEVSATEDPRWNEYSADDVLRHHGETDARLQRGGGDEGPALTSREFQVHLDAALGRWVDADANTGCAEPWQAFRHRTVAALDDVVGALDSGQVALVVTSAGVIGALASALLGAPDRTFVAFNRTTVNAALSKVVIGRGGTTLVSFNEHGHLEEPEASLVTYR